MRRGGEMERERRKEDREWDKGKRSENRRKEWGEE